MIAPYDRGAAGRDAINVNGRINEIHSNLGSSAPVGLLAYGSPGHMTKPNRPMTSAVANHTTAVAQLSALPGRTEGSEFDAGHTLPQRSQRNHQRPSTSGTSFKRRPSSLPHDGHRSGRLGLSDIRTSLFRPVTTIQLGAALVKEQDCEKGIQGRVR
jgi:hypothetical protein